ncbi:MAG: class I SAM-dependent methyltransferase [bacterium]|nr:class I SAM-dependent methyltransferase [bacterium]
MESKSTDYHDYVFKGGKLVGEFDEMYRNSSEVPWHQDESAFAFFSDMTLAVLKSVDFASFMELGCGLGYFTRRIRDSVENPEQRKIYGVDISEEAVVQAAGLHAGIDFFAFDVLEDDQVARAMERTGGPVDLLLSKEVLWYVTDRIDDYVRNTRRLIGDGGRLYISQSFPEIDNYYGKELFASPAMMREFFDRYFVAEYVAVEEDSRSDGKHMLHYIGRSR